LNDDEDMLDLKSHLPLPLLPRSHLWVLWRQQKPLNRRRRVDNDDNDNIQWWMMLRTLVAVVGETTWSFECHSETGLGLPPRTMVVRHPLALTCARQLHRDIYMASNSAPASNPGDSSRSQS
jgi:hypothetical protein